MSGVFVVTRPSEFRSGDDGALICRHRDVSCCDACASAHWQVVDVCGAHFWVDDLALRAELGV